MRSPRVWAPTGVVSATCEVQMPGEPACGQPATVAYPAMGGGYCSLCPEHGQKHLAYCVSIEDARLGKEPAGWESPPAGMRRET